MPLCYYYYFYLVIVNFKQFSQALKYQHLVKLISEPKLDTNTRPTYWKGTVALLILHSQRNTSMTVYGTALLDTLNNTSQEYVNVFLCGLKEIFTWSKSLTLGQNTLIGKLKIVINVKFC